MANFDPRNNPFATEWTLPFDTGSEWNRYANASVNDSTKRFFTTWFARETLEQLVVLSPEAGRLDVNVDAVPAVYRALVGELVLEAFDVVRGRLLGGDTVHRFLDELLRLIWTEVVPIGAVETAWPVGTAAHLEDVLEEIREISESELISPSDRRDSTPVVVVAVIPTTSERRVFRAVRCALAPHVGAGVDVIVARGPAVEIEGGKVLPLGLCNIEDIDALSVAVDRAIVHNVTLRQRDPEWLAERLAIERRIRDEQLRAHQAAK